MSHDRPHAALGLAIIALASLAARPARAAPPEPAPVEADADTREIVVDTPHDTASGITLAPEQIAAIPVRTAEDALRLVPGLVLVQHGAEGKGQQYFLRGFDAVHGIDLEVEAEGVPLNEWSNVHAQGYLDLGLMIPELIAGVEVLPGSFAVDQGPFALAGSARFALGVAPDARGLRASAGFGSTLRQRLLVSYSPREGDGSRFVAAELMRDPGFGESRDSQRAVVMVRQHLLDRRSTGRLSLLAIGQLSSFGLPGVTRASEYEAGRIGFWGAHDGGHGEGQRALLALTWQLARERQRLRVVAWSGYRRLELQENFTGFLEQPELGDRRVQRQQGLPFGLRVDHLALVRPRLDLVSGLGVRGDVIDQSEDRVDLSGRRFESTRDARAVQADVWLLSGLRWRATPTLELAAGLRFDMFAVDAHDRIAAAQADAADATIDDRGGGLRFALSPRAHLRWSALARLELFAAYGRGFRPPEARAFTRYDPTRFGLSDDREEGGRPRSTASDAGELGLRWTIDPRVELRVAGFATYLANESIYDHVSRTNLQLSATRRLGAVLDLAAQPLPWLGLAGSVTYVDARFVQSRNPVPLAPPLVGSVRAWLAHPIGARAGLMLIGWSPRPLPYGARGSGLARLDATFGWHREHVRVDLAIENLLGMRLREGEYYFASNWQPDRSASQLPSLHFVPGPPLNARLTLTLIW
ncbi:TonB-dependent receptor [Nannocystaceae bacterium ST9]